MSLVPQKNKQYDPFQDFFDLSQPVWNLSLFPKSGRGQTAFGEGFYPALDVSEEKGNLIVKADLPGLKKDEIDISIDGSVLTIRGERKHEEEKQDKNFHRVERSYGSFERSLDLGVNLDESKVKARYNDGVLEISVPKTEVSKTRKITVE